MAERYQNIRASQNTKISLEAQRLPQKDLEPIFLKGAPSSKAFQEQKREWAAQIFDPEFIVHVVPKKLKQEFSGPHKVLIDDMPENIEQWKTGLWAVLEKL